MWIQSYWDFCSFDAALRGNPARGQYIYVRQCPDIGQYGHVHTVGGVISLLGVAFLGIGIYQRVTSA